MNAFTRPPQATFDWMSDFFIKDRLLKPDLTRVAMSLALAVLFAVPFLQAETTMDLRARYSFDGGSGADSSGNGTNITLTGVTPTTGPRGLADDAGLFDGTASSGTTSSPFAMENHQTYSVWIMPTNTGGTAVVLDKGEPGFGGEIDCQMLLHPDGKIQWLVNRTNDGTGLFASAMSTVSVPFGSWSHVAGVIDRSGNQIRLYINGVMNNAVSMGGRNVRNTNRLISVGKRNDNPPANFYQGSIDELRVYNRTLSPSDITELATATPLPTETRTIHLDSLNAVDTFVRSDTPGASFGTRSELRSGSVTGETRAFLQFPVSGLPTRVLKATLHLHCKANGASSTGTAGQTLHLPDSTWGGNMTWTTKPASSTAGTGVGTPVVGQAFAIDITAPLQGWLAGNPNHGIELRSTGETGKSNTFASLESSIPGERPYLTIEHAPSTNTIWLENFNGTSLDPSRWTRVQGGMGVANGIATLTGPGTGLMNTAGKVSFTPAGKRVFEFRARRTGSYQWGFQITDGANSIVTFDDESTGFFLGASGVFAVPETTIAASSTDWKEYRMTIAGTKVTVARGDTLSNLTESREITLAETADGRNMFLEISCGHGSPSVNLDWIRADAPCSIEGTVAYSGPPGGKLVVHSGSSRATFTAPGPYKMDVFPGAQEVSAYLDANDNGHREPWEAVGKHTGLPIVVSGTTTGINITLAPPVDTDNDGMADAWEIAHGLNPAVKDGLSDADGDGLSNLAEYRLQTQVDNPDSDNDGVTDGAEVNAGGNALSLDSDGDGLDDAWEISNQLDPLTKDSGGDRDLDGLTNLLEYTNRGLGYRANAWNSKAGTPEDDHLSDYRRMYGKGWTRRAYDRNDRLVSTERDNGFAQIYAYDANSNKKRDILLQGLDTDGDTLPDAWEHANDLPFSGIGAATGNNGATGDPDGDGFTNLQEWLAGSDPNDPTSHPTSGAIATAPVLNAAPSFIPTRWVMATGRLNGYGSDQVVAGADGASGSATNHFSIFTRSGNSWTVSNTDVGNIAINSLAVGTLSNGRSTSIFLGSRPPSGSSSIQEFRRSGSAWTKFPAAVAESSASTTSMVIAANSRGVIGTLSPASLAPDGAYRMELSGESWLPPLSMSNSTGRQSWPAPCGQGYVRWLTDGNIEAVAAHIPASLGAKYNPATGSWYYLTPNTTSWNDAESYAVQNGAHLVTINDAAEQQWIQSNFPATAAWIGLHRDHGTDILSGWKWTSGSSYSYSNWAPGQPDYYGATEIYGQIYDNGRWNDLPPHITLKGLVEVSAAAGVGQTIVEPATTEKIVWSGRTLAAGKLRDPAGPGRSAVHAFIEDKNSSGAPDHTDTLLVGEHEIGIPNPALRTSATLPLSFSNAAGALGIVILQRKDPAKPGVLVLGEPDGTVSLWTAPDATAPLLRSVLTAEFRGSAWHQLERFREADGSESLVGLLVAPGNPGQCRLIYWPSHVIEDTLSGKAVISNTAPLARILPSPSAGGIHSTVGVRLWDPEAHPSSVEIQYLLADSSMWQPATLSSVNGSPHVAGTRITTHPGGVTHTFVWNAEADLGNSFSGHLLLRSRGADAAPGEWSPGMPYNVITHPTTDSDGDGLPDAWELTYLLDSHDPADVTSDDDGDGVSAFLEYSLAMNPTLPDVNLLPRAGKISKADGEHLTLTYTRPKNSGLVHTPQRSTTLAPDSWQSGAAVFEELPPLDQGNGTESVTVMDRSPISANRCVWLRLKVSK